MLPLAWSLVLTLAIFADGGRGIPLGYIGRFGGYSVVPRDMLVSSSGNGGTVSQRFRPARDEDAITFPDSTETVQLEATTRRFQNDFGASKVALGPPGKNRLVIKSDRGSREVVKSPWDNRPIENRKDSLGILGEPEKSESFQETSYLPWNTRQTREDKQNMPDFVVGIKKCSKIFPWGFGSSLSFLGSSESVESSEEDSEEDSDSIAFPGDSVSSQGSLGESMSTDGFSGENDDSESIENFDDFSSTGDSNHSMLFGFDKDSINFPGDGYAGGLYDTMDDHIAFPNNIRDDLNFPEDSKKNEGPSLEIESSSELPQPLTKIPVAMRKPTQSPRDKAESINSPGDSKIIADKKIVMDFSEDKRDFTEEFPMALKDPTISPGVRVESTSFPVGSKNLADKEISMDFPEDAEFPVATRDLMQSPKDIEESISFPGDSKNLANKEIVEDTRVFSKFSEATRDLVQSPKDIEESISFPGESKHFENRKTGMDFLEDEKELSNVRGLMERPADSTNFPVGNPKNIEESISFLGDNKNLADKKTGALSGDKKNLEEFSDNKRRRNVDYLDGIRDSVKFEEGSQNVRDVIVFPTDLKNIRTPPQLLSSTPKSAVYYSSNRESYDVKEDSDKWYSPEDIEKLKSSKNTKEKSQVGPQYNANNVLKNVDTITRDDSKLGEMSNSGRNNEKFNQDKIYFEDDFRAPNTRLQTHNEIPVENQPSKSIEDHWL